jgi:heme-degrading monooxygenase HmoA
MYARISTFTGEAEALSEGFRSAAEPLESVPGFSHAYFLVDRANNKAISITIWESEDALGESSSRADELRKGAAESAGGTIGSVESYEIVLTAGAKTGTMGS